MVYPGRCEFNDRLVRFQQSITFMSSSRLLYRMEDHHVSNGIFATTNLWTRFLMCNGRNFYGGDIGRLQSASMAVLMSVRCKANSDPNP